MPSLSSSGKSLNPWISSPTLRTRLTYGSLDLRVSSIQVPKWEHVSYSFYPIQNEFKGAIFLNVKIDIWDTSTIKLLLKHTSVHAIKEILHFLNTAILYPNNKKYFFEREIHVIYGYWNPLMFFSYACITHVLKEKYVTVIIHNHV